MPMMTLNLALLFVLQLAALQFLFRNRQNLFHRVAEFFGRPLDLVGDRHVATVFRAPPKRNLRLSRDFDLYRFLVVDDYGNRFPVCMKARNIGSGLPHGWHTDKDQNHHGEDSSKQKRIEISEQCVHPASYATA
jgi:hypothetical protein